MAGLFAETREKLAGYYLLDVPDLDTALNWDAKGPPPFELRMVVGTGHRPRL